jgi:hypothetical protein
VLRHVARRAPRGRRRENPSARRPALSRAFASCPPGRGLAYQICYVALDGTEHAPTRKQQGRAGPQWRFASPLPRTTAYLLPFTPSHFSRKSFVMSDSVLVGLLVAPASKEELARVRGLSPTEVCCTGVPYVIASTPLGAVRLVTLSPSTITANPCVSNPPFGAH